MRLLLLVFLFNQATAQEVLLGGVDVGNGRTVKFDILIKESFPAEKDLVDFIESKKEEINNLKFKNLARYKKELDCAEKGKLANLEVSPAYPFIDGKLGEKVYNGKLTVELKDCKK